MCFSEHTPRAHMCDCGQAQTTPSPPSDGGGPGRGGRIFELPLPVSVFPQPAEITEDLLNIIKRELRVHRSFLLFSVRARTTADEKRTLQMALDVTAGTALLAHHRHKLQAPLALGLVFAAGAGVWGARPR